MLAAVGGSFLFHAAGSSTAMTGGDMFALGVICGVMVGTLIGMLIALASPKPDGGGGWWRRWRDRPVRPGPSGGGGDQPKPETVPETDIADSVEQWLREVTERKHELEHVGSR